MAGGEIEADSFPPFPSGLIPGGSICRVVVSLSVMLTGVPCLSRAADPGSARLRRWQELHRCAPALVAT